MAGIVAKHFARIGILFFAVLGIYASLFLVHHTHAQTAFQFTATLPISLTLDQGEAFSLPNATLVEGGVPGYRTSAFVATQDANVSNCVTVSEGPLNLTITAHSDQNADECTAQVKYSVTDMDGDGNNINRTIPVTVRASQDPIVITEIGSATDTIPIVRGFFVPNELTAWFSGGEGTVTYTATSSNPSCVAVDIIGTVLFTTTHTSSDIQGICESVIKVTATDSATPNPQTKTTSGYTIQVLASTPLTVNAENILNDIILQRGASIVGDDLLSPFAGGNGELIYTATSSSESCVSFTISQTSFTLTAHNDPNKPAQCSSNIVITATDATTPVPQTIDAPSFTVTVPSAAASPQPDLGSSTNLLELTAEGAFLQIRAVSRGSSTITDVAPYFTGGTAPLTYTVTSSEPGCVTTTIEGATLTYTSHISSDIPEGCSSLIEVTATDATTPVPQTITTFGFVVEVGLSNPILNTQTPSDIVLARGATETDLLSDYFSGGNGELIYTVTSSNKRCVTFSIDEIGNIIYTANNNVKRPEECSSSIIVTATDSHTPVAQTVSATPFITITVPGLPFGAWTIQFSDITLAKGESTTVQNLFQYFTRGVEPYTFTASTDDTTNCPQNTATINANTLTLTAHTDNAGECATTEVTVTATDTAGEIATQTFTLTVRDPSTSSSGGGSSNRQVFKSSNLEFETLTLNEGETRTVENLNEYFLSGSQPYTYSIINHTQSKCEENEAEINRDTLILRATDSYSLSCATTNLTLTATDSEGRNVERELSFTVEVQERPKKSSSGGGSGGSSGGGSGGSGGSSGSSSTQPSTSKPEQESQTNTTQQQTTQSVTSQQQTTEASIETPFTKNLIIGQNDIEVKELQQFLNNNGFPITQTGPGSSGQETTYFGQATQRALKAYQQSKNIPQTGILDETTKTAIAKDIIIKTIVTKIVTISIQIVELQIQELLEEVE